MYEIFHENDFPSIGDELSTEKEHFSINEIFHENDFG
jgi:hypothetical protein